MRALVLLVVLAACERDKPPATPPCKCEQPAHPDARESPALAKRHALERLIAKGPVLLRFDARKPGVIVPEKYTTDPQLRLRVGRDLSPQIPDLVIDDRGVAGSLQFDGKPVHCFVPWAALYGLQLELPTEEEFWRGDLPPDLHLDESP